MPPAVLAARGRSVELSEDSTALRGLVKAGRAKYPQSDRRGAGRGPASTADSGSGRGPDLDVVERALEDEAAKETERAAARSPALGLLAAATMVVGFWAAIGLATWWLIG
jgi:hypothetical protein